MTDELPELLLSQIADRGFVHTGRWALNPEGVLVFAGNAGSVRGRGVISRCR